MSHNWTALVAQGRAKAPGQAWSEDEWTALLALETGRGLSRVVAANYLRNGITTIEDYDKTLVVGFVPQTPEEAERAAQATLAARGKEAIAGVEVEEGGAEAKASEPKVKTAKKGKKKDE